MSIEIVMPRMGLTMESGTVVAWLKKEGETVHNGEPLLEIETDKTTVEIPSPGEGTLGGVVANPGHSVPVGEVIAYLLAAGEAAPTASRVTESPRVDGNVVPAAIGRVAGETKVKASPAARNLARKLNANLGSVQGTGPGGRVVAWNVEATVAGTAPVVGEVPDVKASPMAHSVARDLGIDLQKVPGTGIGGRIVRQDVDNAARPESDRGAVRGEIQKVSRAHQIMAERMTASFSNVPHFYLSVEADARPLVELRRAVLSKAELKHGVHLTFTDLLIRMCALTLAQHPGMMAQWDDGALKAPSSVSIGVAVDSANGLIVPVVRDADRIGVVEITRRRTDLVERARVGRLMPQDLEGGVFTISNLGVFRIDSFQAIINSPQAAILAVGQVKARPFVENGAIVAADTVQLTLSIDHRVADGATAARFFGDLVDMIENPGLAL